MSMEQYTSLARRSYSIFFNLMKSLSTIVSFTLLVLLLLFLPVAAESSSDGTGLASSPGGHWTRAPHEESLEALQKALADHRIHLGHMMSYRGLLRDHYGRKSDPRVGHICNILGMAERELKKSHHSPVVGILFYHYYADRYLRTWLISSKGVEGYDQTALPRALVAHVSDQLRCALGVDQLRTARVPTRVDRGITLATQGTTIPLRVAIAQASELLIPGSFSYRLHAFTHVLIVPAIEIATVPFSLLQLPDSGTHLIDLFALATLPNLIELSEVKPWRASFPMRKPLIIGNPTMPSDRQWVFPPLLGAEREARQVASLLGVEPLIGKNATKESVVPRVKDADFLYFATHGVAAEDERVLDASFLVFSGESNDYRWTAREIQQTRMKAPIATLSACQTGLGKIHDAGVLGLARAFQISGVGRVVVSLWNVDDTATEILMMRFVENLAKLPPADALRAAMIYSRMQDQDPVKWAPFTLFGVVW